MTDSTLGKKKAPRRETQREMESRVEMGPRASTIANILGYSKALQVVDAPPIGQIDVILN